MARIGVVTDSTADLPATSQSLGIAVVPLVVNWDGQTYRDKIDLTTTDFYRRLRTSKTMPTTGAPSAGVFEQTFREQLEANDAVVCVTLASGLSATYDIARTIADSLAPDRIRVIESGSVSIGLGWLAELAARRAADGAALDAIAREVEARRSSVRVLALLDTLEYLKRGGRIGRAQALAGTLLNVKPIIAVRDGGVHPVERVRTRAAAVRRLVQLVRELAPLERVGVMHADAPVEADEVARLLEPHVPDISLDRGELTAVVGTHGGPGVIGVGVMLPG